MDEPIDLRPAAVQLALDTQQLIRLLNAGDCQALEVAKKVSELADALHQVLTEETDASLAASRR